MKRLVVCPASEKKMVYPLLDHTYLPYLSARAINYTLEYGIPAPCFLIHVHYGPRNQASFLKLPIISKIVPELPGFHAIVNRKIFILDKHYDIFAWQGEISWGNTL